MALRRHIPNLITSMNLVCGLVGVVFALRSRLDLAFYCMLAASVFDFLDGLAARLLGAYSDMGKELDSLCDLISFGFLPGLMLSALMQIYSFSGSLLSWTPLLLTLFAALRLAKFNVDARQASGFLGLPTPAAALLCGALCCYCCHTPLEFLSTWVSGPVFIPLLTLCLCILLVSEVPMFGMKIKKGHKLLDPKRIAFLILAVAAVLAVVLLRQPWSLAVLAVFFIYVVENLVLAVINSSFARRRK